MGGLYLFILMSLLAGPNSELCLMWLLNQMMSLDCLTVMPRLAKICVPLSPLSTSKDAFLRALSSSEQHGPGLSALLHTVASGCSSNIWHPLWGSGIPTPHPCTHGSPGLLYSLLCAEHKIVSPRLRLEPLAHACVCTHTHLCLLKLTSIPSPGQEAVTWLF